MGSSATAEKAIPTSKDGPGFRPIWSVDGVHRLWIAHRQMVDANRCRSARGNLGSARHQEEWG